MLIAIVLEPDDVEIEVDTDLYKHDANYRLEIHEKLQIAEGQEDLDWDYICASEEELRARGEKPAFSSADYPTDEAASEALRKFIDDIWEEVLREREANNRPGAARA